MDRLLATNAPLAAVESTLGVHFVVSRRGSAEWNRTFTNHTSYDIPSYKRIVETMEKSDAIGHTSSSSLLTWIFLDKNDRLVGFEVGSQ